MKRAKIPVLREYEKNFIVRARISVFFFKCPIISVLKEYKNFLDLFFVKYVRISYLKKYKIIFWRENFKVF